MGVEILYNRHVKIAILGGRFDPPHIGHYLIAKQVLEMYPDIEKVLFIPVSAHQWKPTVASGRQRLAMLESFKEDRIEVLDIEIKREGISYSIDTIKAIKSETNAQIFWIVGSDILSEFHRWENAQELVKLATFLVFPRDPYHLPDKLPTGFTLISGKDLISTNLSSTIIRKRIKEGKSISHLVPKETEAYIKKHKLYK